MNNLITINGLKNGRIFVSSLEIGAFTDWGSSLERERESELRFLRASKMTSSKSLFDEVAAALQFPYYFGENWDALDECLNDLWWLKSKALILFISQTEDLLDVTDHFTQFLNLLNESISEYSVRNQRLILIMQCKTSRLGDLKTFLDGCLIEYVLI